MCGIRYVGRKIYSKLCVLMGLKGGSRFKLMSEC